MASSQQSEMECDSDGFSSDFEYYSDQDNAQNRYHTEDSDSSMIDGDEITSSSSSSSSDSDSECDGECQSDLPTGMSAKEYLRFVLETLDTENLPEFSWAGSEKVFCSPNFQPAAQPGPTRTMPANSTAIDYFNLFYDDDLMEKVSYMFCCSESVITAGQS